MAAKAADPIVLIVDGHHQDIGAGGRAGDGRNQQEDNGSRYERDELGRSIFIKTVLEKSYWNMKEGNKYKESSCCNNALAW